MSLSPSWSSEGGTDHTTGASARATFMLGPLADHLSALPEEAKAGPEEQCVMLPHMCVHCQKQLLISESHHHRTLLEQLFLHGKCV